ncbi:MAG: D-tyrosyl-tRNA(Tyr) deacylase [Deltaproteobacteria bacterium]|nr:D-tyrosyl-tRNA(Tyr) deacylase [Deltaproteobacteria bacterium]MCB9788052.1 D-tyrosyl-tRNA(Tyr) deacylase [Deltaproteobacteria bacterium]
MRAVVQRVSEARVDVEGDGGLETVGATLDGAPALLVLLGAGAGDDERDVAWMASKIVGLRIFEDAEGKMNLGLGEVGGSMLVVSQFTLYGDCRKGRRPSFVGALEPGAAERLVDAFVARCRESVPHVATGRFRTHMHVRSVNDGPVTLLLDSRQGA